MTERYWLVLPNGGVMIEELDDIQDGTSLNRRLAVPTGEDELSRLAQKLNEIVERTGIDGVLCSFPDFVAGVRDFGERVRPLM